VRKLGGRLRGLLALAAISLAAISASARDQWLYANTGHFEVFTNARAGEARQLVARLEAFRENFLRVFHGAPFREPRVTVVIFDDQSDFLPYKPLYKGKPKENLAGVFQGFPDEAVIALTTERDLDQTIPVIFHEYVHMLMHARGFRLPPWLNEGMAELYSTLDIQGEMLKIGEPIAHHLMLLNRNALMPLSQLFSVTQASPEYNEGARRSLFYAQSWALLHYWNCGFVKGEDQSARMERFFDLLQTGRSPDESMQAAFGKSLADVQKELSSYVRGGRYMMKGVKIPKVDYTERVKFRPASDFERDVALANLKWRLQRNGDANYAMLQFAERDAAAARPYELLAAIAMMDRERTRAIDYWRQAAERRSENPYIYVQLAEDTLRQSMHRLSLNFRLPEVAAAELRGWLDRALELNPDYAEAWDWLALTEAFSHTMRKKVVNQAIAKHQLLEQRPRFIAAIALIAMREGNKALAAAQTQSLLARPDVNGRQSRDLKLHDSEGSLASPNSGTSWMWKRERYPDVQYIARAIKQRLEKEKPAPENAEPAEVPTDFEIKDIP
jgi:hypothetical protein